MTNKCGNCDFTNIAEVLCPQCKEFQDEIVQNNIRGGEAYERMFNKQKENGDG